jgi:hypothetical protein
MIPYIRRDGEMISSTPIKIETTLYMFALSCDWNALNAVCDRYLNIGGETTYRPLAPMCILYFSEVDNYPIADPIGWAPEIDFGFWMPVGAGRTKGGVWVPERPLAFTPYIWVDSGLAIIGGRTVFGFMKEMGRMRMPATPKDEPYFFLETDVIRKFAPESKVEQLALIETRKAKTSLWTELKDFGRMGENLLKAAGEILAADPLPVPSAGMGIEMLKDFGTRVPMVFLKQFPAAEDASKACYQAIVEAPVEIVGDVKGGWLKGEFEVDIWSYDSHKIVESLGLKGTTSQGKTTVRSLLQGWTQFTAIVQPGVVAYQRGG